MNNRRLLHLITEEEGLEKRLVARISECKYAIIASAFFTSNAYKSIEPAITQALDNEASITFLIGRLSCVTEPIAIKNLFKLQSNRGRRVNVYFDSNPEFHYKIACLSSLRRKIVLLGSSNLTQKGLSSVGEINLEIINHETLFTDTLRLLKSRLEQALNAEKYLPEYEKLFNRSKKFRQQKQRWEKREQTYLSSASRNKPSWRKPEEASYLFCQVDDTVKDRVLKENIEKERRKRIAQVGFSNQWILLDRTRDKKYKNGVDFFLRDDIDQTLGFAKCTGRILVLNEKDKEELVIFFRYHRGWKLKLKGNKYNQFLKTLRIYGRKGKITGKPLNKFIKSVESKRLRANH